MKRLQPLPPLLIGHGPPRYVIDSSAWFNIRSLSNPDAAWTVVYKLIAEERLCLPVEVIEELRPDDEVWPKLRRFEKQIKLQSEEKYLLRAGVIAAEHPALAKLRSRRTRADPFVIAVAEIEGMTVVCDEGLRRPNSKVPTICKKRSVLCVTLVDMITTETSS